MESDERKPLTILFISRAYPPTKGGIERQNEEVYLSLSKKCNVVLVKNPYGKLFIPIFIPYAILIALFSRKYDAILLGDGVLSVIGFIVKRIRNKKVACLIHGLDVTFLNPFYQHLWVDTFIPRLDTLIVHSRATLQHMLDKDIPADKLTLIPNGVSIPKLGTPKPEAGLRRICGTTIHGTSLFTLGRLVKRKGVEWFIRSVLPLLDQEWTYIVAGNGKEKENIRRAILETGLSDKVILLGEVNELEKEILLRNTDIFIQPNIHVAGDIEGFGLVVLEAGSHGTPVIATSIDGLRDAITDGENGFLIPEKNAEKYASEIGKLQRDKDFREACGKRARAYCQRNLTWDHMANRIHKVLQELIN